MITDLLSHDVQSTILRTAIIRNPLIISPDTTVQAAIDLMSETGLNWALVTQDGENKSKQGHLIGILVEKDILQRVHQAIPTVQTNAFDQPVHLVMRDVSITLHEFELTGIQDVFSLFQRHRISHLPILDDHDRIAGLLVQECLTQQFTQYVLQIDLTSGQVDESDKDSHHRLLDVQKDSTTRGALSVQDVAREEAGELGRLGERLAEKYWQYRELFDLAPDAYLITDPAGIIQLANQTIANQLAVSQSYLVGKPIVLFINQQDYSLLYTRINQLILHKKKQVWEIVLYPQTGNSFPAEVSVVPIYDESHNVTGLRWLIRDISERFQSEVERHQAELLLEIQKAILEQIAKGDPLPQILEMLIRSMEEQLDQAPCSILLCDGEGYLQHGAAPHLPSAFLGAIDRIPIGEGVGSCGTAAFRGQTVVVTDIANDPLWQNIKELPLKNGLRACWSVPIIASDQQVLGTFAVYHYQPYTPNDQEIAVAALAANIAGIAIEREKAIQSLERLNQELEQRVNERTLALQASEERLQLILRGTNDGIWDWDLKTNKIFFSSRWKQMRGFADTDIGDSPDECISRIHPDDYDRVITAIDEHFAGHTEFFEIEYRIQRKDGSYMWVLDRAQALRDESGQVIRMSGSETDISSRKQAENALYESQQFLQTVLDSFPLSVFWKDRNSVYLGCNRNLLRDLGLTSDSEIIGKTDYDFFLRQVDADAYRADDQQVMNANQAKLGIVETQTQADGRQIWAETNKIPLHDWTGEVIGVVGTYQDITDRKQAELALQESQRFIQQIADASPNILYLYDLQERRNIYANREIAAILGYTPEEVQKLGNQFTDLLHPEDLRIVLPAYYERLAIAQDGEIIENEYRLKHANGEWRWLLSRDSVFSRDSAGRVKLVIGTAQDISDRKRLQQEQDRLITLLEASTDYILITDLAGRTIWNNVALKQFRGLNSTATKPQSLSAYYPEWSVEMLEQMAIPAAIAEGSWLGENILLDADGREIPVSQLLLAHPSPQGEVEFFSTIMRDMRVHKEYEQRLEQTNAALLRATRLKDDFLANMSHELRTPLNAILGMAEGLQEQVFGTLNERQLKALRTIDRSGSHLLELINDILDVAKIEAGQIDLKYTPTSIPALCQSSLVFIKQQSHQKNIQLEIKLPNQLPSLIVDERRIRQVLINLLNNAMKFTPAGGQITLEVSRQDALAIANTGPQIRFSVIDTGIGIAPEHLKKLFQPFIQIDSALNRQYTGTGLGLALVKRIVELHGGNVHVTSELGVGSSFMIDLPCSPDPSVLVDQKIGAPSIGPSPSKVDDAAAICQAPLILMAEDNEANISTVSSYLEAKGYRILVARDGQTVIELAKIHQPDLILMDIQMPGMDGLEAIRQIRMILPLNSVPIIALTALAMTGDREKCLQGGANDYLTKPVKLKQLASTIQQHLAEIQAAQ